MMGADAVVGKDVVGVVCGQIVHKQTIAKFQVGLPIQGSATIGSGGLIVDKIAVGHNIGRSPVNAIGGMDGTALSGLVVVKGAVGNDSTGTVAVVQDADGTPIPAGGDIVCEAAAQDR